jgi:hypothetical protein
VARGSDTSHKPNSCPVYEKCSQLLRCGLGPQDREDPVEVGPVLRVFQVLI